MEVIYPFSLSYGIRYPHLYFKSCDSSILFSLIHYETYFFKDSFGRNRSWIESSYSFFLNYLFIFGCAGSVLLCKGFPQLWWAEAALCVGVQASHCGVPLVAVVPHEFSCPQDMWDLPGPGRSFSLRSFHFTGASS